MTAGTDPCHSYPQTADAIKSNSNNKKVSNKLKAISSHGKKKMILLRLPACLVVISLQRPHWETGWYTPDPDTHAPLLLNLPAGCKSSHLTQCQGCVLFWNIFLGFRGQFLLRCNPQECFLWRFIFADNRLYTRFEVDCYHTLALISPCHGHYFKENAFEHVLSGKDCSFWVLDCHFSYID